MTVYYSIDEAINHPKIPNRWPDSMVVGLKDVCEFIGNLIIQHRENKRRVCLLAFEGFLGVEWERIIPKVSKFLRKRGVETNIIDINSYYRSPSEIRKMISPFVEQERDFGYVFKGRLEDFLDFSELGELRRRLRDLRVRDGKLAGVICFGVGVTISLLRKLYDYVFYFDSSREKLFNSSEEKPVFLLGSKEGLPIAGFLKRFYYVDSQVVEKQKKYVLRYMNWYLDASVTRELKLVRRDTYEEILSILAQYPFVMKPLYYPVSWGGTWLKKVKNLPKSMINSGQGFLVAPENTVRIAIKDWVLEIPFTNLLWREPIKIMGVEVSRKFQGEFPLNYWYDDGYGGDHMAIQVHPNGAYMKKHFNEPIRQDESYFILHTGPGAKTYLGLKEGADLDEFWRAAVKAEKSGIPLDHDKYVNSIPTESGDYFLIPAGTIHASGTNQVVLQIDGYVSAYSPGYTLHIYDYLRPDLDGRLRAIHLKHAFNVLRKTRRSRWVLKNLKQTPRLIRAADDWSEFLLGKREDMFYEVHRLEFATTMEDDTNGRFHMLTLVEGETIIIRSRENPERQYELDFPDTVLVPAAVGRYVLVNRGKKPCKLVKALVK